MHVNCGHGNVVHCRFAGTHCSLAAGQASFELHVTATHCAKAISSPLEHVSQDVSGPTVVADDFDDISVEELKANGASASRASGFSPNPWAVPATQAAAATAAQIFIRETPTRRTA